jgi:hypothetical protein
MNTGFQKFFSGFTLFTLIVALIFSAVYIWVPQIPITHAYPYLLLLIYLLTLLIIYLLIRSMEKKPNRFVNAFMLMNFGKLFLYVIIIFIYAWLNREDAVAFIITFFAFYLIFTAYEIVFLLRLSKKAST